MWKWFWRIIGLVFACFVGLSLYGDYRAGYFSLPEFSETSYAVSFKNGLRGIVIDPEVSNPMNDKYFRRLSIANPDRRYIGVPIQVAPWFENVWSLCHAPTDEEKAQVNLDMPEDIKRQLVGARLDAICMIEADDANIPRGFIFSVQKL